MQFTPSQRSEGENRRHICQCEPELSFHYSYYLSNIDILQMKLPACIYNTTIRYVRYVREPEVISFRNVVPPSSR